MIRVFFLFFLCFCFETEKRNSCRFYFYYLQQKERV